MYVHFEKTTLIAYEFNTRLNLKLFEYHGGRCMAEYAELCWKSMSTNLICTQFIGLGEKGCFFLRRLWKQTSASVTATLLILWHLSQNTFCYFLDRLNSVYSLIKIRI